MNSNQILASIDAIAASPGKLDKQAMVTSGMQHDLFRRVCSYAYNPFKTYGIAKRPETIGEHVGREFDDGTWELLDGLIARRLTGNSAIEAVRGEMTALSVESAELFWRIVKKDLRAGFSESTINKACKGMIPTFPYMRCSLPKDANLADWPWADGIISQEKADGMFANVDYELNGLVSIRSRQGTEFPMDKFPGIVADVRRYLDPGHQCHGEFVVTRGKKMLSREISNGIMNSVVNGVGDFETGDVPMYLVWDQIPLTNIVPKGKYAKRYRDRLAGLIRQLRQSANSSVCLIQTKIVRSLAEAKLHAVTLMKQGKEGTVVKHPEATWADGTSKDQIKIKLEFEVDLEVVAVVPGKVGGKNEGRAGSLNCKTSDGLLVTDITVKNEAMRLLVDTNPEDWIGRIIAVVANDIMKPSESSDVHSLFLPRMVEAAYRADKTVADSLERVFAQKEAAIYGEEILKEAA